MASISARICGLVLAAGAGTRFGGPKVLARAADGTPWVTLAVRMLRDAGCADVIVVLGASAAEASALVPGDARIVVVANWCEGMGASLRAGLDAVFSTGEDRAAAHTIDGGDAMVQYEAVLVTPVDTPDAAPEAAVRVIEQGVRAAERAGSLLPSARMLAGDPARAGAGAGARASLARAVYAGDPGHPVLIGRDHWRGLAQSLSGDSGASRYLRAHAALEVECGDLWSGADVDVRSV